MSKKVDIKRGSTVVAVGEGLEYHGEWMQHGYVTVTVKSAVKIDFHVGDYVVFRGEKFYLWSDESWKKQARSNSYGEAYVYENMKLWDSSILLEQVSFRDFVLNWDSDANVNTYSSLGKFSFFGADIDDLADRIQANLDRVALTIGSDVVRFKVLTPSEARSSQRCDVDHTIWNDYYNGDGESSKTDIVVNVDSETLWGGLARAYNDFGMTYFVDGKYIVIGAPATTISEYAFVYGRGHELKTIEQHVDDQQRIVTRLFAYGSTKNMPANYYANQFRKMGAGYEKRVNLYDGTSYYFLDTNIPIKSVEKAFGWGRNGRDGRPEPDFGHQFPNRANMNVFCSIAPDDDPQADYEAQVWVLDDQQYGEKLSLLLTVPSSQSAFQPTGGTLYVVDGADINYWPASDVVELDGYLQNLAVQNLMLPGFPTESLAEWAEENLTQDERAGLIFSTDVYSPWIQSAKSSVYGVREGDVYFDGSGDMEEIFPTIANTGANSVQSAAGFDDHGHLDEGGTFTMQVRDIGIEWDKLYVNGMTISMTSGYCTGRDFTVDKKPVKANGSWTFTLTREQDERGCFLPNVDSPIESGDVFIVSGIELPAEYVEAASEALLRAAIAAIKENDEPKRTYTPSINNIYMAKDLQANGTKALHYKLRAGTAVAIQLDDAGTQDAEVIASVIDALTIKDDGGDGIATYEITLRDEKEKTLTQTISEAVSKGSGGGGSAATSGRAYRLSDSTPRTAWGRQFWENGQPRDVSGNIDDAEDINMSGILSIDGFEVSKDADGRLMHDGDIYATGSVAALGYSAAGGGGSVVLGPLLAELNDEPMPVADGYLHWTGSAFEWVEPGGGGDMPSTVAWNNITGKPATFTPSEHKHDERYYIENGTIHLGDNSITPITSHQSLAAYTPTANYQALNIKVGSTVVGTYAPTQALNFSIAAGSNISVTADATNKKITIANTYSYTHPTNGANKTISAANGVVLSAITVNNLGHVTSVASKTLGQADIPALDASKITSGTFNAERIPGLAASKITGGVLDVARIPSLTKSKISDFPTTWAWSAITGTPTTLAEYGITDAATAAQMTAATGRLTTLEGYFDNGVANSAKRLSGTASYTVWGQTYWENGVPKGNIKDTLYMLSSESGVSVNTDSAKLKFNSYDADTTTSVRRSPYIQALWEGSYGRKRLSVFQSNEGTFDPDLSLHPFVEVFTIKPNGNVGIGTSAPSQKLHVVGNIMATGAVSCLGTSAEGSEVTGAVYLRDLQDVLITGTPETNYVLTFNGSKWVPQASQGGDMSQYATKEWVGQQGYVNQQWVYNRGFAHNADLQDLYNYVDSTFVQSLGVSGDYVTWTKAGTTNQLTVPFATRASELRRNHISSGTLDANTMTIGSTKYAIAANYYSTDAWENAPSGMNYGAIMELTAGSGAGVLSGQLAWDSNHNVTTDVTRKLYWRSRNSTGWGTDDWHTIAFEDWVTTQLGGYLSLSGGQMANTNRVVNLNADLLDGKHASDFVPKAGYFYQMDGTAVTPARILLPLAAGSTGTYSLDLSGYLPLAAGADKALTGQLYLDTGGTTEVYVNVKSNRATANGGGWAFPLITARNAAGTSVFSMGVYGAAAASTYSYIGMGAWNAANNLRVYTDGSVSLGNNIKYQGTKAIYDMISFIDNTTDTYGNGIAIGGGGATIIGGGESASVMASQLSSGGSELMYIGNDQGVSVFTNLQNGWDYRKEFTFYNTGVLSTAGSVVTPNGSGLYIEDTGGTERMAVFVNDSNQFFVGFGMRNAGYTGYFDSNVMHLRSGASGTTMTLDANNRVGIGTTAPYYKLDVNGAAHLSGDGSGYGLILANDKAVSLEDSGGTIRRALFLNANNQLAIGYGTTKGGTAANQYDTAIFGRFISFGTGGGSNTDPAIRMTISSAGNVGIGTNNPQYRLHVDGSIVATGAVSALGVSSQGTAVGAVVADTLQVAGTSTLNGATTVNNTLDVSGDVTAENDVTVGGNLNLGEEGYIYAVGDELFWYAFSTGMTKKIAFV